MFRTIGQKVTYREVTEAYLNWTEFFKNCPNQDYCTPDKCWQHIEAYIGGIVRTHGVLPEENYQRLERLLGPNYKTILAAYCVKYGIKWK